MRRIPMPGISRTCGSRGNNRNSTNVDVSPDLISRVTNAVIEEVREWQNRAFEKSCAVLYLDAPVRQSP
jgi:hypothetical protein